MRAPAAESRARNCSCCWTAEADQARISCEDARPPAARTRAASEGGRRSTTYRWAVETTARTPSTPCHPASSTDCAGCCAPAPTTPTTAAASADAANAARLRDGRVRIEVTVARVRKRLDEARARRDHCGVVRAEGERGERSVGQRRAEL